MNDPRPVITLQMAAAARALDELSRELTRMIESLCRLEGSGARADRGDPCGDTTPLPPGSTP